MWTKRRVYNSCHTFITACSNQSTLRFFFIWHNSPQWARASSFTRFLDHTYWRTTVSRTPLDEWLARCIDLYLKTHNTTHKHPCPRWDSNPRSQQASGRRPTPWTARPLGPALEGLRGVNNSVFWMKLNKYDWFPVKYCFSGVTPILSLIFTVKY